MPDLTQGSALGSSRCSLARTGGHARCGMPLPGLLGARAAPPLRSVNPPAALAPLGLVRPGQPILPLLRLAPLRPVDPSFSLLSPPPLCRVSAASSQEISCAHDIVRIWAAVQQGQVRRAAPRCATLCRAVPHCAALYRAVPRCCALPVLFRAKLCRAALPCRVLRCAAL